MKIAFYILMMILTLIGAVYCSWKEPRYIRREMTEEQIEKHKEWFDKVLLEYFKV
jgi:hypothetical protein